MCYFSVRSSLGNTGTAIPKMVVQLVTIRHGTLIAVKVSKMKSTLGLHLPHFLTSFHSTDTTKHTMSNPRAHHQSLAHLPASMRQPFIDLGSDDNNTMSEMDDFAMSLASLPPPMAESSLWPRTTHPPSPFAASHPLSASQGSGMYLGSPSQTSMQSQDCHTSQQQSQSVSSVANGSCGHWSDPAIKILVMAVHNHTPNKHQTNQEKGKAWEHMYEEVNEAFKCDGILVCSMPAIKEKWKQISTAWKKRDRQQAAGSGHVEDSSELE